MNVSARLLVVVERLQVFNEGGRLHGLDWGLVLVLVLGDAAVTFGFSARSCYIWFVLFMCASKISAKTFFRVLWVVNSLVGGVCQPKNKVVV